MEASLSSNSSVVWAATYLSKSWCCLLLASRWQKTELISAKQRAYSGYKGGAALQYSFTLSR